MSSADKKFKEPPSFGKPTLEFLKQDGSYLCKKCKKVFPAEDLLAHIAEHGSAGNDLIRFGEPAWDGVGTQTQFPVLMTVCQIIEKKRGWSRDDLHDREI